MEARERARLSAVRGKVLGFENDKHVDRKRKPDTASDASAGGKTSRKKNGGAEIGDALRSAYQRAVAEDIPPDLLDLLGKLG
jgi:hypothetical protein